jgi:hypothetical protein
MFGFFLKRLKGKGRVMNKIRCWSAKLQWVEFMVDEQRKVSK